MITPKPLNNYLKTNEEYNKLYDEKVKEDADWWEGEYNHNAIYPTDEDLKDMREVAESGQKDRRQLFDIDKYYRTLLHFVTVKNIAWADAHKYLRKEAERILWKRPLVITDEYIKDLHQRTLLGFGVMASSGIKDYHETLRAETIRKWKKLDKVKQDRILKAIPFDKIKCKNCGSFMTYQWSQLIEPPGETDEKVLFIYICKNQCKKEAIFEDGTPWIMQSKNLCAICQGNRSSTVTKDNKGNTFIIFECQKCGSREVEKIENMKSSS